MMTAFPISSPEVESLSYRAIFNDASASVRPPLPTLPRSPVAARELDRSVIVRGKPRIFVSDNGTEPTTNAVRGRTYTALQRAASNH
jgi:hypothetical protein